MEPKNLQDGVSVEALDNHDSSDSNSQTRFNKANPDLFITDDYLIELNADSPLRPRNWTSKKKLSHTVLYALITFAAQFNSTTMTSGYFIDKIHQQFGIAREVTLLGTTFYILGIAIGPMVFAPLSEVYGRKIGVLVPFFISALFTFATSISYNVPGILVTRFFAGFFAGAPIVSAGGVMGDIWHPSIRGAPFAFYACFVVNGAALGPTICSLLIHSNDSVQSWRIAQWFTGLLDLFLLMVCVIVVDESYEPVLLSKLARDERFKTNNWAIHSKHDMWKLDVNEMVTVHLLRPFEMLATPIVFLITLFASYVYGLFYLMITNLPEAFHLSRGWNGTTATLPNISLLLGVMLGCLGNMLWAFRYAKIIKGNGGEPIPEERFPIIMVLAWLMPVGIFLFGWTSYDSIHWIVPCLGILFIGCGFITIFQGCINYLVDTMPRYAASAIACNTFGRSIFASTFPLFAKQLFINLGVHWGSSVIGFIALGMIPIPFYFYKFGARVRANNRFAN